MRALVRVWVRVRVRVRVRLRLRVRVRVRLRVRLRLRLRLGVRGHDLALLVDLAGEEVSQRRLEPVHVLPVVRLHLRAREAAGVCTAATRKETNGGCRVGNVLHARSVAMTD